MSKEVKRYVCRQGEMHVFNSANPNVFQYVDAADYDALLAERDALKKDAERYRWLRLQTSRTHTEIGEVPSQYRDQFIDSALQES